MVDRVSPLKIESADTGGTQDDQFATSLNRNEDFVDARGITFQDNTTDDELVKITRDNATGDLTFEDNVTGLKTLAQLAAGAGGWPFTGKILTVGASGADHTTLQAAADAMDAGDAVLPEPGNYPEELILKVNGFMFSLGGVTINPTISVEGNSAVSTIAAVTAFTFFNIDIKPIVTNATVAGTNGAVIQGQDGLLRFINCEIIPETAAGIASDLTLRALRFTSGSLEMIGSVASIEDVGNRIATGTKLPIFYTPAGTIRLDGGSRVLDGTSSIGNVIVNNASLILELGECLIDGNLQITAAATATRTGATVIGTLTDSTGALINVGPQSRNDSGIKQPVRLATVAALAANTSAGSGVGKTLTADVNGTLPVDGQTAAQGDRIAVLEEATQSDRGLYDVTQAGSGGSPWILTRATDFDNGDNGDGITEVESGVLIPVQEGTLNGKTLWRLATTGAITIDTTSLTFERVDRVSRKPTLSFENPSTTEDLDLFFTDVPITITRLRSVIKGTSTPSLTWQIRHDTNRSAAGTQVVSVTTTNTTTGENTTTFDDATIPADSWVWFETSASGGSLSAFGITVFYTED